MFSFLQDSWVTTIENTSDEDEIQSQSSLPSNQIEDNNDDRNNLHSTISLEDTDFISSKESSHDKNDLHSTISSKDTNFISSNESSRIRELEEQNSVMVKQLESLQGIISSKTSLYLDYKSKYEASEEERMKSTQQSTDTLIVMQNEIAKLEAEVIRLQQCNEVSSSVSDVELFKANLQAEKDKECRELQRRLSITERDLAQSRERVATLEAELEHLRCNRSDTSNQDNGNDDDELSRFSVSDLPLPLETGRRRKRKQPPNLLETRILEARHMQWASSVHLRESAVMFKQSERVSNVIEQMALHHREVGNDRHLRGRDTSATEYSHSSIAPLKKAFNELEKSFESSRSLAVMLDARLEAARHTMYADVLSAVEPEVDAIDEIYSSLDHTTLQSINNAVTSINKSIRYRPGESKLRQEQSAESLGGTHSAEYLYSLRSECVTLLPIVKQFAETAVMKCPGLSVAIEPEVKSLEDIMDDCFLQHKGDYSLVCDMVSCTMVAETLDVVREFLGIIGSNDGERKRVQLPGSMSFSTPSAARFPRYALLAIKNKFNSTYDAVGFSAGYRDMCVYLRFVESPHPLHVIELRLDLQAYVDVAGLKGGWVVHFFKVARPLKIFDDPLRTHIGPVDKESAMNIKEGITHSVCMDHFSFSLSGGDYLISALSQSPYCAVREISLHGSGLSDNDLSVLLAVLSIHKRLKVFRASGERDDIRGLIQTFPWDVLEREAGRVNRPSSLGGDSSVGFAALQKLDLSYNSIRGSIYTFISSILPNLRMLNFDDNSLTGHIPPDIGNISNLQYIILSRNELTGPIPTSIGNLRHLKDFQVWQNKLTGPIPASLGNLNNLLRMNVDSCMLSGTIPEQLGCLTSLRELYCFDNRLSGPLPSSLSGMINLQYLGLNGNQFTGPIPTELGRMRKLRTLFLHENSLSGTIPPELGRLVDLKKLSFRGNRLSGRIPPELCALTGLQALALSENQLTGEIPQEITRLEYLEALTLANNRLTGSLPRGLSRMSCLKSLDITKNQISGAFPVEVCTLSHLRDLLLADNFLEGPIPHEIGKLSELCNLELSGNRFRGAIPTIEITRIRSLQSINLSRNYLIHADAAQKYLEERLRHCFINVDSGQRPKI
mmetsp:Transcript_10802/g.16432  ORF Transcript_10802/g.16432 Transcript_10802/m.16432 type:complete len:1122 (-) Transcript_10802:87-3452(-)